MKRTTRLVRAPSGQLAPMRRAMTPEQVGQALEPGVVVEADLETALACGAWFDDIDAAEVAFEAAEDPSDFWDEEADGRGTA